MSILITGGAGYIGSHVAKQLLEQSNETLIILDNLSTGSLERIEILQAIRPFVFIEQDLNDWKALEKIFQEYTITSILHFAAFIVVPESVVDPLKYYMNNTVNTTKLIDLAVTYGVRRFIFSSTAAVYGEPDEVPVKESTKTDPINPYGMSKLMSETVLRDASLANPRFKHVILRYFNVAGAALDGTIGQSFPNATHLIKVAAQTVLGKREKLHIFGTDYATDDGTCIRDYIHVDDLASAHLKALTYLNENESDTFNVGYGHGFSVKDVVSSMKKVSQVDFQVDESPRRLGDPALLISDNTKIKTKMHWIPSHDDLNTICRTALDWERTL